MTTAHGPVKITLPNGAQRPDTAVILGGDMRGTAVIADIACGGARTGYKNFEIAWKGPVHGNL